MKSGWYVLWCLVVVFIYGFAIGAMVGRWQRDQWPKRAGALCVDTNVVEQN